MNSFTPESFIIPLNAEQAAHQALVKLEQEQEQEQLRQSAAPETIIQFSDSAHHPSEAELHDIFANTPENRLDHDTHIAHLTDVAKKAASIMQETMSEILDRVTLRPDEAA
jgi:hypothetical protein